MLLSSVFVGWIIAALAALRIVALAIIFCGVTCGFAVLTRRFRKQRSKDS